MIFKLLFAIFVTLQVAFCQYVPVLLWGVQSDLKPALKSISPEEFQEIVLPHLDDRMALVFIEPELTVEDLSHCEFESGTSCFQNLKLISKTYYNQVENPVATLKDAATNAQYVNVNENGDFDDPVTYEEGKVVFINFQNDEKVRSQRLHKHDSIISNVYQKWSEIGKIVALYMGQSSNLVRKVRDTAPTPKPEPLKSKCFEGEKSLLVCYTDLEYKDNEDAMKLDIKEVKITSAQKPPKDKFDVEIDMFENRTSTHNINKLTFTIMSYSGYWNMTNMRWNDKELKINPAISIPQNFSYYCGVTTNFSGANKMSLIWSGLQMEAFFNITTEKLRFHDAWHCVGFTSPAIWMGLFVTFMLLIILTYGITWMMDIRTMDRFDDPKGKTITVNVSE